MVTNEVMEITIKLKTRPTIQLNGMALLLQEILGLATLIHITKVKVYQQKSCIDKSNTDRKLYLNHLRN